MKPLFLVDLDDTLFQTRRKMTDGQMVGASIATTLEDGTTSAYRTTRQQQLMVMLSQGDVIPVTARNREVMARVDITQAPAICSNGGVIVDADGRPNQEWRRIIETAIGDGQEIETIKALIARNVDDRYRHWMVEDDGLPLYAVLKRQDSDEAEIARIADVMRDECEDLGWTLHHNGNNMSMLPPWLSKKAAVQHLIARVRAEEPDRLIIGMGDSLSDTAFMLECDYAMTPSVGQIATSLRNAL